MSLTVHQQLALDHPYDDARMAAIEKLGVDSSHLCVRWISTDLQVIVILTVGVPAESAPFWHVSMGVEERGIGPMAMRETDRALRGRLREVGQEMLREVGESASDKWTISERTLHLKRLLTLEEIEAVCPSE